MTKRKMDRRDFLKHSGLATAALTVGMHTGSAYAAKKRATANGKKVIIIGVDGMDPRLSEKMMDAGQLPNFDKLRKAGGYRRLGTSTPPQSPVAWANFINGAGPGSHGIFDFIHRNPEHQVAPFFSAAETVGGSGYWNVGDHKLQLPFWPFNHKPGATLLRRAGVPFWDYLDEAGISSTFYNLPTNYPPSPSKYGNHKCLSGMGTPDMLGSYGTYQHYAEDGPVRTRDIGGGRKAMLFFENETANAKLMGPPNSFLKKPHPVEIDFAVHRDTKAGTAVIEIQEQSILLKEGQWSDWINVSYEMEMPWFMPDEDVGGICRFYLQEVGPNFRLYVTPINADPSSPAIQVTEPPEFVEEISDKLGLFYTTGFQEDHKALSTEVFSDDEFVSQSAYVLKERLNLLDYAVKNYDDGLLYFYFSSTDLQAHMLWWDSDDKHPTRSKEEAKKYFNALKDIYRKMDCVLGDMLTKYGDKTTIMVLSDHGFANFKRQFNVNSWLRENGYVKPVTCKSVLADADWSKTKAYGLGINGLYVNLKGRERDGIVAPADYDKFVEELITKLEAVRDTDGSCVIRKVHRADKTYSGSATALAPDLIIGYARGYRASWDTCLGDISKEVLSDNDSAWAADHCADPSEVPGVLFSNKPIDLAGPSLIDIGPSVLSEFGLSIPPTMEGKNIYSI